VQNVHEMTIGSIMFQVAEGDITKEEGDVIVNITNAAFNLKTGILVGIMWENSTCGWKGWITRAGRIFSNVSDSFVSQCGFCFPSQGTNV